MEKKPIVIVSNNYMQILRKLNHFSEMHNDALLHREGLKGQRIYWHGLTLSARGSSESDICRRQILTYKDGPRTESNKLRHV